MKKQDVTPRQRLTRERNLIGRTSYDKRLKKSIEVNEMPDRHSKVLAALEDAWEIAPNATFGKLLSWIAKEDDKKRQYHIDYSDNAVRPFWNIDDKDFCKLINKWINNNKKKPSGKRPVYKFPIIREPNIK